MKYTYFLSLLLVFSACKPKPVYLQKITAQNIAVDSIKQSKQITDIIEPYKEKLAQEMNQVLSYNPQNLNKNDGNMQSSIGNMLADLSVELGSLIYKDKTGNTIDFCMLNHGGVRASIQQGDVTMEDAFRVMPFENELVVVELTGDKVEELFQYFVRNKRAHPLSKNVALIVNNDEYSLDINSIKFNKNKTYHVLTNDYLQSGGDNMNFFKNPKTLTKLDYKLRDAIIDYFKENDTLKVSLDNRVIVQ